MSAAKARLSRHILRFVLEVNEIALMLRRLRMTGRQGLLLGTSLVASLFLSASQCAAGEPVGGPVVRIAELEIEPAQLDAYKIALKEEIEISIRVEPGVLTL